MDFASAYPWLKSVHIIFVIYWMAGLFMLPRYFAYHAEAATGSAEAMTWQDRERKLMRIILTPAMAIVWVLGLWLAIGMGVLLEPWMLLKLLLVIGLSGLQGFFSRCHTDLAAGTSTRSSKFFRMLNEVPTLTVIVIVILIVVKPWG